MRKVLAERNRKARGSRSHIEKARTGPFELGDEARQEFQFGQGPGRPEPGQDALSLDDGFVRMGPAVEGQGAVLKSAPKAVGLQERSPKGCTKGQHTFGRGEGHQGRGCANAILLPHHESISCENVDQGSYEFWWQRRSA